VTAQNRRKTPEGRKFPKGQSGNPGGRPKGLAKYIRERCGANGELLIDGLVAVVNNDVDYLSQRGMEIPNTREWLEAHRELLDRGYGKAPQTIELTGDDGGPVQLVKRVIVDAGR
jgi:hypothetical protein